MIEIRRKPDARDRVAQQARAALLSDLAALRWQRETGGLTLPDGASIITTRESQAQIGTAVQSLALGLLSEPVAWKLESGWVDLTADQVRAVAAAVTAHVQACFEAERVVAARIASGDLAAADDLPAAFANALAAAG